MRPAPWLLLEPTRLMGAYGRREGAFVVSYRGQAFHVIASEGEPGTPFAWEHVSVSLSRRCPTWEEMCHMKELFWLPEEAVMQLHPPASEYVNRHPYCLHLWRPTDAVIPLPLKIMVG